MQYFAYDSDEVIADKMRQESDGRLSELVKLAVSPNIRRLAQNEQNRRN